MGAILSDRRRQSESGLADLRNKLSAKLDRLCDERVAIYVTGSFGRLEARYPCGSDLDVFFMYMPEDRSRCAVSRLVWYRLIAAVIEVADDLNFEPFSKDGEFLTCHNVFQVGSELGSREEDATNGFTARLLLLLEGRHLANEALYDEILLEAISFYYRDYASHRETFWPSALLNDILRYWRTLLLNYEHQRERKREKAGSDEEAIATFRAESGLDNLKLRYSRLALCFSMVAALLAEPDGISPERLRELCKTPPAERWHLAADRASCDRATALVPAILEAYEEFLGLAADENRLLQQLRDQDERGKLRKKAAVFGDQVHELLDAIAPSERFRRLVV